MEYICTMYRDLSRNDIGSLTASTFSGVQSGSRCAELHSSMYTSFQPSFFFF